MSAVSEMLRAAGACEAAIEWASAYEDPAEAWAACTRVGWLFWWVDRCGETPQRHLLIADLAEPALPIYEAAYHGDARVRDCVEARRAYARGEITEARWVAAWDAAWDAARVAAMDAALAAAGVEAGVAAWAAARAAAWDAVSASDATSAEAMDASWDAACAAACAAAWGAGWDAAWKGQRAVILQNYPTPPMLEAVR